MFALSALPHDRQEIGAISLLGVTERGWLLIGSCEACDVTTFCFDRPI